MIPYVATIPAFSRCLDLHAAAMRHIAKIGDDDFPGLRCHELTRALSRVLDMPYQDGYFGDRTEHTWLWRPGAILDPYMPGAFPQCVLLETDSAFFPTYRDLYTAGYERADIKVEIVNALVELFTTPREDRESA